MAQLADEHEQHRDEVEEVENDTDPDGTPGEVILDHLVTHESSLNEQNVTDKGQAGLIEALKEVVPVIVVRLCPAGPDHVEDLGPHEDHRLEEGVVMHEYDEADEEHAPHDENSLVDHSRLRVSLDTLVERSILQNVFAIRKSLTAFDQEVKDADGEDDEKEAEDSVEDRGLQRCEANKVCHSHRLMCQLKVDLKSESYESVKVDLAVA